MDIEQVIQWAEAAGFGETGIGHDCSDEALDRFAALVWNAAIERAAEVCDVTPPHPFRPSIEAAYAIRALKQPTEDSNG